MEQYRKFFPALSNTIYADTAAAGLMYDSLLQWRQQQDLDLLIGGSTIWPEKVAILDDTRRKIRQFFKAEKSDVALLPNFSLGLNLLLENQGSKQKVLLIENDYPSVNWPFMSRDFDIHYVETSAHMEEMIAKKVKNQNISVLALSLIQWLDGIKINLDFLRDLKRDNPSLLIIADGTQYCGAFDIDFDNSGIDVLGASGYKWLLGGYGNGFMLFKKEIQSRFSLRSEGFNSTGGNLGLRDQITFCKRLEPGHLDSLSFGSLKHSLDLLDQIGMKQIESYNRKLVNHALKSFGEMGILEEKVMQKKEHGAIFRLEGSEKLYEELLLKNVRCSWRAGGIRLSLHFYNTKKEIDQITEIIKMNI